MSGFTNDIMNADNVNFTGANPTVGSVTADGQLLIGASTSPFIRPNTLTAGTGITITNGPGSITVASTASLTDLHTARFIVASSTNGTGANFTTVASAIAAAQGTGINSTIFLQPGTYTENFTLPPGINLCAYTCDATTPNVTIVGNITVSAAGTCSISGIRLQTNGAAFLTVSANAAIIVNLDNCYLNCTNATGISFSSASASAKINLFFCKGNIGTTGISLFSSSSAGVLTIEHSEITNTGASTTASTCSAGQVVLFFCIFYFPITNSGTNQLIIGNCHINTIATNTTGLTFGGSGVNSVTYIDVASGSASSISVGSNLTAANINVASSNTNAITGAGTLTYSNIAFTSTSFKINTTTQVGGVAAGGLTQAPSAGFIGERIEGTATAVAMTSTVAKTITSISLTPGIWDVSGLAATTATGGTAVAQAFAVNISTTNNTITGTLGIEYFQITTPGDAVISGCVPAYRVTLTATTTYYLVGLVVYTSTTSPTNGRISATRVG